MTNISDITHFLDENWELSKEVLSKSGYDTLAVADIFDLEALMNLNQCMPNLENIVLLNAVWQKPFSSNTFSDLQSCWDHAFEVGYQNLSFVFPSVDLAVWCPEEHRFHILISPKETLQRLRETIYRENSSDFREFLDQDFWSVPERDTLRRVATTYGT